MQDTIWFVSVACGGDAQLHTQPMSLKRLDQCQDEAFLEGRLSHVPISGFLHHLLVAILEIGLGGPWL